MARPKKQKHEQRSERFNLRYTIAELEFLRTEADKAGLNIHEYARRRTLGARVSPASGGSNPALINELNRIGVNLNQLMPMGHLGKDISDECADVLGELRRVLEWVLASDGA